MSCRRITPVTAGEADPVTREATDVCAAPPPSRLVVLGEVNVGFQDWRQAELEEGKVEIILLVAIEKDDTSLKELMAGCTSVPVAGRPDRIGVIV